MASKYALARTWFILLTTSAASIWAALTQQYVFSALFACATTLTVVAALVRGLRRASSVIDGADRMLAESRQPASPKAAATGSAHRSDPS